jgi:hypothetical protein
MTSRLIALLSLVALPCLARADTPAGLTADERAKIDRQVKELGDRIQVLRRIGERNFEWHVERLYPDAEIFRKAVIWALRYEPKLEPADVALIQKALKRCRERVEAIEADKVTWWPDRKGKVVRGYKSSVDDSVQPFGVVVPKKYDYLKGSDEPDPAKRMRYDVVLHGSMKPTGMAGLRFLFRFDEGDGPSASVPDQDFLEVHPFGRCENCYRWAGETDVFDVMNRATGDYMVDYRRPVLRGMSMGASGTWHLGLKHPDKFAALGPYCGYVDTHEFSKTPMPNFVPVGPLPPYQEAGLHLLDSVDYAGNASTIPVVAAIGDKDPFFQAHALMAKAMEKEGLKLTNLISPGTGHVIDPKTHKEQMRRIAEIVAKPPEVPKHIRFVTWTLRYRKCEWLTIEAMEEHYKRAELDMTIREDGTVEFQEPVNVTRFEVSTEVLHGKAKIRIGRTEFPIPKRLYRLQDQTFRKEDGKWVWRNPPRIDDTGRLPPGAVPETDPSRGWKWLMPIDYAFAGRFLCVRGTGRPWNPAVEAWADSSLKRFADEWARYFRGDLPVKDDKDVTDKDIAGYNLILFGDPGSNSLIARVLPTLPITWTREELGFGDQKYPAATHAPVLIHPNRLSPDRPGWVVLNSGHTFHAKELSTLNYLLFPRLGEGAVMKVGDPAGDVSKEKVIRAGFFDAKWRFK